MSKEIYSPDDHSSREENSSFHVLWAENYLQTMRAFDKSRLIPKTSHDQSESIQNLVINKIGTNQYAYASEYLGYTQDGISYLKEDGYLLDKDGLTRLVYDSWEVKQALEAADRESTDFKIDTLNKSFMRAQRNMFLDIFSLKADLIVRNLEKEVIQEEIKNAPPVRLIREYFLPRSRYERNIIKMRIRGEYVNDKRYGGELAERLMMKSFERRNEKIASRVDLFMQEGRIQEI